MHIHITDENGANGFDLPQSFHISDQSFTLRNEVEEAFYLDGGRNVGTNGFNSVNLKLKSGFIKASATLKPERYFSQLLSKLKKMSPFRIYIMGIAEYADWFLEGCYIGKASTDVVRKFDLMRSIEFDVMVTNPFWNKIVEDLNSIPLSNGNTFTLVNAGDYPSVVNLYVENTSANQISQVKFVNTSFGQRTFESIYPYFNINTTMTINSQDNIVNISNTNITHYTNGNFIYLKEGSNVFKYEGSGDITITKQTWKIRNTY